ncbi:TetR/AcrR family transcriptional regulator [Alkalibacillus haloalkaliphilus]|uniref:TetR/AcrR family transcriptional regulator n=1 Tax=Alkalibacillus haloalkaliphilus TaxID=94136 RepID=UPI0002E2A66E|nr:TetR/AcrR family transcriptional regulator [Alkalibacillus haloalkaliphilus]
MPKSFHNLEKEKQQRIINAALQEFAEKGYEQASTNQIVKNAGIGKGMLFYYFNNKQELYDYLINYCFDLVQKGYVQQIDLSEPDFIERFRQASMSKLTFFDENPYVFNFLGVIMLTEDELLSSDTRNKIKQLQQIAFDSIYKNIDYSLFREDVDVQKAMDLIKWSMDGYREYMSQKYKGEELENVDMEKLTLEFTQYLDTLKTAFYK